MKLHDDDQQQLAPQEENLEDSDHERRKADADAIRQLEGLIGGLQVS